MEMEAGVAAGKKSAHQAAFEEREVVAARSQFESERVLEPSPRTLIGIGRPTKSRKASFNWGGLLTAKSY